MPPKKLTVKEERVDAVEAASTPLPLHRKASVWPRLPQDAAGNFRAADAADAVGCNVREIVGYGFRAPLDVDGDPIKEDAVLTVVLSDGSKKAVEHPLT